VNKGQHALQCLAKLESMRRTDGAPFKNAFLPIGLTTQHQRGQGRAAGPFNLRPGESKLVEVASLSELIQAPKSFFTMKPTTIRRRFHGAAIYSW